jgi:hypothetical protein
MKSEAIEYKTQSSGGLPRIRSNFFQEELKSPPDFFDLVIVDGFDIVLYIAYGKKPLKFTKN